jgi:Arc/MetJ-type ribon-helix-helix transcriptional regulator
MPMNDVIVSVRMPKSMLVQLRLLAKKNHYLDVSEEIRSIAREKVAAYSHPYNQNVKKIVDDLTIELKERETKDKKQQTISQLKKILEELEHD